MRDIKFQYIYELLGVICKPTLTLEQIEEGLASKDSFPSNAVIIAKRQFTGLTDKNGVEIYEGDIIPYGNKNYEVEYSSPYFTLKDYFIIDYYGHDAPELQDWSEFEVIGNIHQNPELLK